MQTKIIKSDGTEIEVLPKNGEDFSLEELQEIMNCAISISRNIWRIQR